jgi:hypothetical protein
MENAFQNTLGLFGTGFFEVDPEKEVRVRQKGRHEKDFDVFAVQAALRGEGERANHVSIGCVPLRRRRMLWESGAGVKRGATHCHQVLRTGPTDGHLLVR